jgi:hypothetical protein
MLNTRLAPDEGELGVEDVPLTLLLSLSTVFPTAPDSLLTLLGVEVPESLVVGEYTGEPLSREGLLGWMVEVSERAGEREADLAGAGGEGIGWLEDMRG